MPFSGISNSKGLPKTLVFVLFENLLKEMGDENFWNGAICSHYSSNVKDQEC